MPVEQVKQTTRELESTEVLSCKFQFLRAVHKLAFIILLIICIWPKIDTAAALASGIIFSLLFKNPFSSKTAKLSKMLLQISVVGLGFGIGIQQVFQEGRHSILYTIIGISMTILIGNILGKLFKINQNISHLISFGTAICGGSAIAAMSPVLKARDEEIAVSLATVFTLNSIGLLLFPFIGHILALDETAFGTWAALAIHDTSSVVGAAASYGATALAVATTVKLIRALWITPVVLGFSMLKGSKQKTTIPYFIIGFILAAIIKSILPEFNPVWNGISFGARRLLVVTLFLIGAGLTREILKKVGIKPLLFAIILWILVSSVTLFFVFNRII